MSVEFERDVGTRFVYANGEVHAVDLEADGHRYRCSLAVHQRFERDHQPMRLETVSARTCNHERRAPVHQRRDSTAKLPSPGGERVGDGVAVSVELTPNYAGLFEFPQTLRQQIGGDPRQPGLKFPVAVSVDDGSGSFWCCRNLDAEDFGNFKVGWPVCLLFESWTDRSWAC